LFPRTNKLYTDFDSVKFLSPVLLVAYMVHWFVQHILQFSKEKKIFQKKRKKKLYHAYVGFNFFII